MPTMVQAGDYASTLHYLKALEAMGGNPHDGAKVVAKMKEMPTDDPLFGKGMIRVDGRKIHPAYLFEVKTPADSKYPWDYYKLLATIPADEAFRPLAQSECPAGQGNKAALASFPSRRSGRRSRAGAPSCLRSWAFSPSNCSSSFWSV